MAEAGLKERFLRPLLSLRGVAFVSLAAIAVLCAACLSVLMQTRLELVRRADIMASNILVLADQTVQIEVGRYDLRLLDIIADLHDARTNTGTNMGTNTGTDTGASAALGAALFGGPALRNSVGDILLLDQRGRVLASSRPDLTAQDTAALPEILAAAAPQASGLTVRTVRLGGDGKTLITLTRQCPAATCGGAATVVAMLPLTWIQGVFDGLVLGRNGAIALTDAQGTLLARQPALPDIVGHAFEPQSVLARIPRAGATVYTKRSAQDGRCCRVTAGRIQGLPLLVFVSISRADILRGWSHLAFVIIFAVVVLSGALVALTLLLAREVHRKMQVDRQLLAANSQLAELVRTDGLTGLLNRRGFDDTLAREWRRCRRTGVPISLLMLDADHFKAYNDHFGHPAGDGVLRALGACIIGAIRRPGDIAARYGGEEFTVVLPATDLAGAGQIAEGIRACVEALAIPHARAGEVVTVSIGVSVAAPEASGDADGLVSMADAALYESKALGRNRVTIRVLTPQPADAPAPA